MTDFTVFEGHFAKTSNRDIRCISSFWNFARIGSQMVRLPTDCLVAPSDPKSSSRRHNTVTSVQRSNTVRNRSLSLRRRGAAGVSQACFVSKIGMNIRDSGASWQRRWRRRSGPRSNCSNCIKKMLCETAFPDGNDGSAHHRNRSM